MFVKICANTNLADTQLAAELGANAIGFVFAESKRKVTVEQVGAITPKLPATVMKIGVFTSTSADEILQAATIAGLTGIQIHSPFNPAFLSELKSRSQGKLTLWQVLDVPVGEDIEHKLEASLQAVLQDPSIDAVLLDAAVKGVSGGTGVAFDWPRSAAIVHRVYAAATNPTKLIIAGGLRAENVAEAIATFAPFGVDVASGAESSPGTKDPARMRAFIEAAQTAFAKLEK